MRTYGGAKAAYQELRDAAEPWTRANGFVRGRGKATQANWQKPVGSNQLLRLKFEGYSMVDPRYHSLDDARDLAARSISVTPPHLVPKCFRNMKGEP